MAGKDDAGAPSAAETTTAGQGSPTDTGPNTGQSNATAKSEERAANEREAMASFNAERDAIWERHHGQGDKQPAADGNRPRNPDGTYKARSSKPEDAGSETAESDDATDDAPAMGDDADASRDDARDDAGDDADAEGEEKGDEKDDEKVEEPDIPLPSSWPQELSEGWAKAGADVQAFVARRERQMQRYVSRAGTQLKALEPFASVARDHRDFFAKVGVDPIQAYGNLVRTARFLDEKPAEALRWLASEHGLSPTQIFGDPLDWESGQPPPSRAPDPQVTSLKRELEALRRNNQRLEEELTGISGTIAQDRRAAIADQHRQHMELVTTFEKDNPDLKDLADDIVPLIDTYRSRNPRMPKNELLAKAVKAARAMNPKAAKAAADRDSAAKARLEEKAKVEAAAKAAAAARKASAVNVRGSAQPSQPPASLKDVREAIWDKHHSR